MGKMQVFMRCGVRQGMVVLESELNSAAIDLNGGGRMCLVCYSYRIFNGMESRAAALVGTIGTLLFVLETCIQLNVLILHSSSSSTSQSSAWVVDAGNTSSLLLPADNVSTAALWGQQEHERWRQVVVILLGVSLILSSALLTVISIVWVYTTMDFLGSKISNFICIMLHVVQLGWLWRYIKLLLLNDSRDLQEFLLLRLVHASLQSAPFLIIQGFTAIVDNTVITHPVHLTALIISLLSLTVAYTSYQANTPQVPANSIRECIIIKKSSTGLDSWADTHACKNNSQDILRNVIIFFVKLLLLYSRVASFIMLVGVNVMWIILVLPLHSGIYAIIIFIIKYKPHEVLGAKEMLLSAANVIDLICDKPLCEMLIFYVLVTVENIGMGLGFYLTSSWPHSLMLFASSLASIFLGTLLTMLHQGCFREPNHDQLKSSILSRHNIDEPLPIIEQTMSHEAPDNSGVNENNSEEEIYSRAQTPQIFETDENHNDVEQNQEIEKLKEIPHDSTYVCDKHKHPEHQTEALLDASWLAGRTSNDESGSGYFSAVDITTICGSITEHSLSLSSTSLTSHLSPMNTAENSCKTYYDSGYFGDKTSSGTHSIHIQSPIQLKVNKLPTTSSSAFSNRYPSLLDTTHPIQSVSSMPDASSSLTSSQSSLQLVHHQHHTQHWCSLPPARCRQHTLPDHQQGKTGRPADLQQSYNHEHPSKSYDQNILKDKYRYPFYSDSKTGLQRSQTLGPEHMKYGNNAKFRQTRYDSSLTSGDELVDIGYEEESSDWSSYCTTCDESDMYSSDSTMTWPPTVSRRNLSLLTVADHDVPSQQLLHIHSWLHNVHSSLYHLTSAPTPNLHTEDRVRGRREDRGCFTSSRLYHSVYVPKTSAKDKLLALCSGYKPKMYGRSKLKVKNTDLDIGRETAV